MPRTSAAASTADLDALLGKRGRPALARLVHLLADPAVRGLVVEAATTLVTQAQAGRYALADPTGHPSPERGAIERAAEALHAPRPDDEQRLATVFGGTLNGIADLPDQLLADRLLPPAGPWLACPAAVLDAWLRASEAASGRRLHSFDADLGLNRARLADQLDRLARDEEARALVHAGRLGATLRLGRPAADLTPAETIELVAGVARLLTVIVAHLRVALLRRWGERPLGDRVEFTPTWQTVARVMMTSVVAPAAAILPVLTLSDGPCSVVDLPAFLARTPPATPQFIALVAEVAGRCPGVGQGRLGFDQQMARLQADLARRTRQLAEVRHDQLTAEGLGRMSFVQDRLGVSASQGAVLAAWSVLAAPATITPASPPCTRRAPCRSVPRRRRCPTPRRWGCAG